VTFETEDAAQKAIRELHGVSMEGRPLTVKAAEARGGSKGSSNSSSNDLSWHTAPPPRRGNRRGGRSQKGNNKSKASKSWSTWAVPTEEIVADDKKIILNGKVVAE